MLNNIFFSMTESNFWKNIGIIPRTNGVIKSILITFCHKFIVELKFRIEKFKLMIFFTANTVAIFQHDSIMPVCGYALL